MENCTKTEESKSKLQECEDIVLDRIISEMNNDCLDSCLVKALADLVSSIVLLRQIKRDC